MIEVFLVVLPFLVYALWRRLSIYFENLRFLEKEGFTTGGMLLPIIGHALQVQTAPEDFFPTLRDMVFEDPKKMTYLGILGERKIFSIFHPVPTEVVLGSSVNINKSFDYNPLLPWLGRGLLINHGSNWRSRRKLLTPAFHFQILQDCFLSFNQVNHFDFKF